MRRPDVDPGALAALLRRAFGGAGDLAWERTSSGTSTQVYRVRRRAETFYLRVAETETASLAPEAALHVELRRRGVRVPDVVYVEPFDEGLRRSVMVTSEVPGRPVEAEDGAEATRAVFAAAGRDLAVINEIAVEGFGWVRREGPPWPLRAEHAAYPEFVSERLGRLRQTGLPSGVVERVEHLPADHLERMRRQQVMIAAHRLARWHARGPEAAREPFVAWNIRRLRELAGDG